MNAPEIRHGIPIPEWRYRSPIQFKGLLGRMEVGDSIVLPATEHYSVYVAAQRQAKAFGERFSIIRLAQHQVGVWRVA
ncbi:MAG: hypothetical protein J0H00_19755 [Burkholderiales bacterium]|nr:hypothetical protein [Burkholderiales bacterium]